MEITKIQIKGEFGKISLTLEEAKELQEQLNKLFGHPKPKETIKIIEKEVSEKRKKYPWTDPYEKPQPFWPSYPPYPIDDKTKPWEPPFGPVICQWDKTDFNPNEGMPTTMCLTLGQT